ncbi:hypothetical protein KEM56_005730 [Ascosphaera pollenicola]|nr:hypothetical protein KEM56_005730 [Ascosphaera pollenicola]
MDDISTPTSAESEYDLKTWQSHSTPGSESPGPAMTPPAGHSMSESAPTSATATPTGTSSSSPTKDKAAKTTVVSVKSTAPEPDDTASIVETVKTAKSSSQQLPHVSTSSLAPASPSPTTQESFFKSMNKRLQMLETNSTLSLLYIGEQSRILREAFNKVEKRQLGKTTAFLENLNHTVLTELHDFRQQYDQVWQSVIMEFEQQRVQYNREVFAVTRQLGVLADEILFQKRLSLIQSIFLLILFGIMIFSRGPVRRYLELPPRVQGMLGRGGSPILRSSWQRYPFSFPLRSPSQSPLSVPGSPVSDTMVHEQGAEPGLGSEQLVERAEIRHRKSSSTDSQDIEISMSPDPENETYPASDRSHSPLPVSIAPSSPPSSVRFERDSDESQKGGVCMPNGHMIDTPESSELHPTEMVADTTLRRPLSEVAGNRQRSTHGKEDALL